MFRMTQTCPLVRIQWASRFSRMLFLIFLALSTETQETLINLFFLLLLRTQRQQTIHKGAPIPHQPIAMRKGA